MKGRRRYRAALAGYYGFGNLGDELLLRASLETLARCGVGRDSVVVLSNAPEETARTYDAASVSRWSFRAVRRALSDSDTLLLGGGGLFQDSSSVRSCLWYWALVRLARLCGAKPWALGQSIGPLRSAAARWLTRDALGSCAALQLRDAPSAMWAKRLGLAASLGEDLALTLALPWTEGREGKRLLLNLRPSRDTDRFVGLVASRIDNFRGEVVGVALSPEDKTLLEGLWNHGKLKLSRVVLVKGMEDAAELWPGASLAVGMRLHFAVLSALYATPLAVLSYDPKVEAFAEHVGAARIQETWRTPYRPRLPVSKMEIQYEAGRICQSVLNF